jgi:tetratricopeptide (TPR) repeat protein
MKMASNLPVITIELEGRQSSQRAQWSIFRRYLFDYRCELEMPLCLLIDSNGRAAKVYSGIPSAAEASGDLQLLRTSERPPALPFAGEYANLPRRDYFKFAVAMLWGGEQQGALPYLNEVLNRGSENPRVPLLIGQIYLEGGKLDDAEQYIRKAIAANPKSAPAWSELGGVWQARKNDGEALKCFETALSIDPAASYIQLNAAQAAEQTGDSVRAEKYYRQALDSDTQGAEAANGLGLMVAKRGETSEAKGLFEKAIRLKPGFGSAINNLGVLFLNTGQVNDAVAAFEYGLKAAPDDDILYLNLGRIYAQQGRFANAREVMQRLLERKPGDVTAEGALRELENR